MEETYSQETYGGAVSSQTARYAPERREQSFAEKKKKLKTEKREVIPAFFATNLRCFFKVFVPLFGMNRLFCQYLHGSKHHLENNFQRHLEVGKFLHLTYRGNRN